MPEPATTEQSGPDRITVDNREAARLLSISERTLSTLVKDGKIRRTKAGNKNLFSIAELNRFAGETV